MWVYIIILFFVLQTHFSSYVECLIWSQNLVTLLYMQSKC